MKIIVTENYNEMSKKAGELVAKIIAAKPDAVMGLATGDTPVGLYNELVSKNKAGEIDFSRVSSVNLDEYYPISPDNDQSYRYFMNEKLFDRINIDKNNTFVPNGSSADPDEASRAHEAKIDELGGIDIQVLGIGRNGHIGFNEPDEKGLIADTHLTALTPDTIDANSRFFASYDDVPKHALTMGMGSIFKARSIVILVSGENKKAAVKRMLEGPIDTMCPASLLCLHNDVTLICDKDAYPY